jgi:pimeloyl-ACP methyl ester carboxylesterase
VILFFGCNGKKTKQENGIVKIKNTDIAFVKAGTGDTTLFFLHGWCINKEYWKEQVDHFSKKYTVVAIDLPGFGQSGRNFSDWSFENYTSHINEFIVNQKLKNVILIGHSMSGDLLLLTDVQYPSSVTGIVGIDNLQDPGVPFTEEQKENNETFFQMLDSSYTLTVTDYARSALFPPGADTTIVNRVVNDFAKNDSVIATKLLRSLVDVSQQERDLMQRLNHKLFLVNSDMNPTLTDTLIKFCRKSAAVEIVKGTGHYPMIEKPAAFNSALEKIILMISRKE